MDSQAASYSLVQALGKNLFLGFEIFYAFERKLCDLNYCAKYVNKKNNYFFEYNSPMKQFGFSYMSRLSPKTTLGTELTFNTMNGETKAVFGYRKKFKGSEVKGVISSVGKLSTLFTLGQFPTNMARLKLYASGDCSKDIYNFGYGIFIGQEG